MEDIAQKQPNPEYKVAESVIFFFFTRFVLLLQENSSDGLRLYAQGLFDLVARAFLWWLLKFLTLWCRDTAWFSFTVRYTFPTLWNNSAWSTDHVTYRYFVLVSFFFLLVAKSILWQKHFMVKSLGQMFRYIFWLFYAALSVIADVDL